MRFISLNKVKNIMPWSQDHDPHDQGRWYTFCIWHTLDIDLPYSQSIKYANVKLLTKANVDMWAGYVWSIHEIVLDRTFLGHWIKSLSKNCRHINWKMHTNTRSMKYIITQVKFIFVVLRKRLLLSNYRLKINMWFIARFTVFVKLWQMLQAV